MEMVSATNADWTREKSRGYNPGDRLLSVIRRYQRIQQRGGLLLLLMKPQLELRYRFWSAVSGASIPARCKIGGGLLIPHPNGIVIHPDAVIGPNCLIFQQVTIGGGGAKPGVPVIGGHVDIGAGAKLLGGIRVGDHALIGANAVVLCDVPSNSTAVGVPAVIRRHDRH